MANGLFLVLSSSCSFWSPDMSLIQPETESLDKWQCLEELSFLHVCGSLCTGDSARNWMRSKKQFKRGGCIFNETQILLHYFISPSNKNILRFVSYTCTTLLPGNTAVRLTSRFQGQQWLTYNKPDHSLTVKKEKAVTPKYTQSSSYFLGLGYFYQHYQ